jgi:hypothetical protein
MWLRLGPGAPEVTRALSVRGAGGTGVPLGDTGEPGQKAQSGIGPSPALKIASVRFVISRCERMRR